MKIFLLRHGIAEDGRPGRDADRALTGEGREQLEGVAAALAAADVRCDHLRASPLRRALETAKLVQSAVGYRAEVATATELVPEAPVDGAMALLDELPRACSVMLVGHLPHLSLLGAHLVGARGGAINLKKAGLIRIDVDGRLAAGAGELRWLLTPGWMTRTVRQGH